MDNVTVTAETEAEAVDEFDVLDDLDDIEFSLDEIENKIAPLALA
ncbi:hypothetical protein Sxan_00290 [Streptomyces xanthophaeus]|uniref:Uncharacterized protein n=1 Tax=Streptomyces xanthophaeus TaxID=67385 RepID=A0A919GRV6_9ACTN|nr:hypothetical protein KPP03845_100434 [Streptomyces xanthophaeus]GHI82665.1 hypothetical protein Sxan_00290 [Streptomyces xanthophaeus]